MPAENCSRNRNGPIPRTWPQSHCGEVVGYCALDLVGGAFTAPANFRREVRLNRAKVAATASASRTVSATSWSVDTGGGERAERDCAGRDCVDDALLALPVCELAVCLAAVVSGMPGAAADGGRCAAGGQRYAADTVSRRGGHGVTSVAVSPVRAHGCGFWGLGRLAEISQRGGFEMWGVSHRDSTSMPPAAVRRLALR